MSLYFQINNHVNNNFYLALIKVDVVYFSSSFGRCSISYHFMQNFLKQRFWVFKQILNIPHFKMNPTYHMDKCLSWYPRLAIEMSYYLLAKRRVPWNEERKWSMWINVMLNGGTSEHAFISKRKTLLRLISP